MQADLAKLDEHVLREIIRIALQQDWAFYAVAQCISKAFAQFARELAQEHPAPQSLNFVPDMLAPLPPSDPSIYHCGDKDTNYRKTLSFKAWQPFQYPIVDWTECRPSSQPWYQAFVAKWSMLRTSITFDVGPNSGVGVPPLWWMWNISFF